MRTFHLLSVTALAFGVAALPTAAMAAPDLETNAHTEAWFADDSVNSSTDSNSDSSWSNIGVHNGYGDAGALSRADGVLGASASGGSSGISAERTTFGVVDPGDGGPDTPENPVRVLSLSSAIWEDTIVNNSGNMLDYRFLFHVYGAKLEMPASSDNYANVGIKISINGVESYTSTATLAGTTLDLTGDFVTTGYNMSDNEYYFNPFDAGLSIGSIVAGGEFTLRYELWAEARMYTVPGSDWQSGENWAYASIGDPFGWENGPGFTVTSGPTNGGGVPGIPEPATWALLIAGFGLVGVAARRRRVLAV